MAYVYLIENKVNGHKYVGQTCKPLKHRLQIHYADSKKFKERPLYRAFKNMVLEILRFQYLNDVMLKY